MKFTVLGSTGFIGSNLVQHIHKKGFECNTPDIRKDEIESENFGHVIYAIGVPNFKERPFEAVEAHVCLLQRFLKLAHFDSFLYLSGTRVYRNSISTKEEEPIIVNPMNLDDLYNISKLMGESVCMASKRDNIRIARLSNVTGNAFSSDLFLPSIIREAVDKKKVVVYTSIDSEKDYVYIDDVVRILPEISLQGKYKIYNVANGKNVKSKEILDALVKITDCEVRVSENAPEYSFPPISIERIKSEFIYNPISILDKLDFMVKSYCNRIQVK